MVTLHEPTDGIEVLPDLEIDACSLTIGAVSVGLPRAGTSDDVLVCYARLVELIGGGSAEPERRPSVVDLESLAHATRLDPRVVAGRLRRLGL
ncbi:MAG: hypothetical protein ACE5GB_04825 [Acidimicrobiales bacterium]